LLEAPSGEVVAYAMVFPLGTRGDVRQIAVDAAWRRRGLGRELMAVARDRLRAAGCRDWRLEVRADNTAAIALYAASGMHVLHELRFVKLARAALAPPDPRFTASPLAPADDPALEAHYDLGAGELARWRRLRTNTAMWIVREADELAGFARYCSVHEPGCALLFPCRARDAIAAVQLCVATLTDPPPDHVELGVVDAGVADALIAAGGEPTERHLVMAGAL